MAAILAVGDTQDQAMQQLQKAVNGITHWTRKWKIRLTNENLFMSPLP